jgi:hypothetical protein
LLDRKISRARPFQDLVYIGGGAAIAIRTIRAVAARAGAIFHEASRNGKFHANDASHRKHTTTGEDGPPGFARIRRSSTQSA